MKVEEDRHDHEGDPVQNIGDPFHHKVDRSAVISFDRAVDPADQKVDRGDADAEQKGKTHAGRDQNHQILPRSRCPEHIARFFAVQVNIVIVIAYAHAVQSALNDLAVAVAVCGGRIGDAGISFDAKAVVCVVSARFVKGNEIPVFVPQGFALRVRRIPVVGVRRVVHLIAGTRGRGVLNGVDHLFSRFELPGLQGEVIFFGQFEKFISHGEIAVETEVVHDGSFFLVRNHDGHFVRFVSLAHGVSAAFLSHRFVIFVSRLVLRDFFRAVPETEVELRRELRQNFLVVAVHVRGFIGREDRREYGKQNEKKDDRHPRNGRSVFSKTPPRAAEITDGAGGKLFVPIDVVSFGKCERRIRDIGV